RGGRGGRVAAVAAFVVRQRRHDPGRRRSNVEGLSGEGAGPRRLRTAIEVVHGGAAVDGDDTPCYPRGLVAGQEDRRVGDVRRGADAAQRRYSLVEQSAAHVGGHDAGGKTVDAYARRQLDGHVPREVVEPGLREGVGTLGAAPSEAPDR